MKKKLAMHYEYFSHLIILDSHFLRVFKSFTLFIIILTVATLSITPPLINLLLCLFANMNHFADMEIRRILGTSNYLYNHVLRKGRNNNKVYLTALVKLFIYTRLKIKEAYNAIRKKYFIDMN